MKKILKNWIKDALNRLPYIKRLNHELNFYKAKTWVLPGHFYSPIVNLDEVKQRENWIFGKKPDTLYGINLNKDGQVKLLNELVNYYNTIEYSAVSNGKFRYYFENRYYTYGDGILLFEMLLFFKPNLIIEVGSGFSSAIMLDINEHFFNGRMDLTFIEPFPENRLKRLLRKEDTCNIMESFLQDIDKSYFKKLKKDDILFIDSSHVVKTGGELNYLFFEVLEELETGVIIHFHDIYFPFEYPQQWVKEGRSWNEAYMLRLFLMHNHHFEIILFSSFLQIVHKDWFEKNMPLVMKDNASGFWIVKK